MTAGRVASTCTVGLMVSGEADLAAGGAGAEAGGGTGVTVLDLLGAGLMGGTFMDDIITTGGGEVLAGTVLTTTEALDLAGSDKKTRRRRRHLKDLIGYIFIHSS